MNSYLAMQQRLMLKDRERVLSYARGAAVRIRVCAQRMITELDAGDLEAARTRFAELAQLLPQHLTTIDDHLKEAEVVGRFAANMADEEATR